MARVRVLHAIQNLNYGGMERLFADIVRLLDPARFESHVLVLDYLGRFGEGLEAFAEIHRAQSMPWWSLAWPTGLAQQIRAIRPDIVHTHAGVWYKVSLAARMAGTQALIHTEHGRRSPDPWLDRRLGRLASGRTDRVVAVSDPLAEHLRQRVAADPARVVVIFNGVDTERVRPRRGSGTLRAELGLPPDAPVVGSIGRLEPVKGYDIMIDGFGRLLSGWDGGPRPVLVVAGDGSCRAELEQRIDGLGLRGAVFLLGWRDDVADLYADFTCFTMTSRSEGTSVSLLEAMSAGLCPLVSDVGGNRAVLGAGLAHRLFSPGDPDAAARAWGAALGEPACLAADGTVARARVEECYSVSSMVRRYAELYEAVLQPARST